MKSSGWLMASLVLLLLAGAGSALSDEQKGSPVSDPPGITGSGRQEPDSPADPEQKAAASRPRTAASVEEEAKQRLKTIVSLSFTNADLRNVLNGLAKTYGLNIVADERVKGSVNITLKEVTLGEALHEILKLNGYTFLWEGSILKVVNLEEEIVTEVLAVNFIAPDEAMEFLKKLSSDSGIMKIDEAQNAILVTDKISAVEKMRNVLKVIDVPPRQVLIQARLLDITHDDLDNLGLKLSGISYGIHLPVNDPASSGKSRVLQASSGTVDMSGPSSDLTNHVFTATLSQGPSSATVQLDALIQNKRVKVLSSPSVMTLNNVEAKITVGEKFPIKETTQTTTGTLQTTRFVDVGITMRVTPKITQNGYIQMKVHPEVSSVASTIDAGPRITTREADTTLIVKDQETVVIAGLVKEEETLIRGNIPVLGHIPLVGLLFQNRAKTYEQKELVILITPYLVPLKPPEVARDSDAQELVNRIDATEVYREAEDFEFARTLQAKETLEDVRLRRAVDLYEKLAEQFPAFAEAPVALWRAGDLSWDRLGDHARAEKDLGRLIEMYPAHPYVAAARRRITEIRDYLARQERKGTGPAKADTRRRSLAPLGFN